ncbi:hypothetical protein ACHAW6_007896 [Cyclotella cf. meneghiniana]
MMALTRRIVLLSVLLASMVSVSAESSSSKRYLQRRSLVRTSSGNVYDQYIQNSEGGADKKYSTAVFGFIAAVGTLVGFLYLVDRDLFNCKFGPCKCHISCIKIRHLDDENTIIEDQYVTPETARRLTTNEANQTIESYIPWLKCPRFSFTKPRIDRDEKDEIDDAYITPETRQYLAERREEQEKPWKFVRKLFPFLWKTKKYDDEDKYKTTKIDPTEFDEADDDDETIVSVLSHHMEEVRLRLFWKPTKDYDENDKYAVAVKKSDSEEERDKGDHTSPYRHVKKTPTLPWEEEEREKVETKPSSFESADSTVVPYK